MPVNEIQIPKSAFSEMLSRCLQEIADQLNANTQAIAEMKEHTHGIHDAETFYGLSGPRKLNEPFPDPTPGEPQENTSILRDFQRAVRSWAAETFPTQTPVSIVEHLRREVEELAYDQTPDEAADCFLLLLLDYAEFRGFDLLSVAKRKFEICKTREWGEPDSDGVIEHIEPAAGTDDNPEGGS